ncbi:putative sulfotransferase domain protein [Desulfosarcina variabilis str. Montpellier]|uniref:sulfotransferase family protein n=1 Tax=Desulfosarcina variabilis TaxID=2300 RepID=UPI003AFAB702
MTNRYSGFQISKRADFKGPLFLIGMPRSGTKLLRSLLIKHPSINISRVETNFLHLLYSQWKDYGDLSDIRNFKHFFDQIQKYSYFYYMKQENKLISYQNWYNLCCDFSLKQIYEALLRHDTNTHFSSNKIWGDKSPSHINHLPILNTIFPEARFIHIIRDVRDYCLSINNAWGKNMFRAAQRWRNSVIKVKSEKHLFDDRFYEIKYEDLISETSLVLKGICAFLDIEYIDAMCRIDQPVENLGDAINLNTIKKDNKNKYKIYMSANRQYKIESLTADALSSYGYDVNYNNSIKEYSQTKMLFFKIFDALNLFIFYLKEKGLIETIRWNLNFIKIFSRKLYSNFFKNFFPYKHQ